MWIHFIQTSMAGTVQTPGNVLCLIFFVKNDFVSGAFKIKNWIKLRL